MTHPFDTATALEPLGEGAFRGRTSPAYANRGGPSGGVAAACLRPARIGGPGAGTVNDAAPRRAPTVNSAASRGPRMYYRD